jgi:hypothetical protein
VQKESAVYKQLCVGSPEYSLHCADIARAYMALLFLWCNKNKARSGIIKEPKDCCKASLRIRKPVATLLFFWIPLLVPNNAQRGA